MEKFHKTATLTFHASHNYGSMLQAYALQQIMQRVFGHNTILNLRTKRQRDMMEPLRFSMNPRSLLKSLVAYCYIKPLKRKWNLFEEFIKTQMVVDNDNGYEVLTSDMLSCYSLICSGSDQIWNPNPVDFDKSYYIPFDIPAKKISYAASMGPKALIAEDISEDIANALLSYDRISVREHGTKTKVEQLSGRNDVAINCDPVLLLSGSEWLKLINPFSPEKTDYILLYSLFSDKLIVECAKYLEKELKIPVIMTSFTNSFAIFSRLKKRYSVGPIEFLNYLYHAKAVITSSFHGTAFSVLFNKPFYSINGLADNRISTILKGCHLENQAITSVEDIDISQLFNIDFRVANDWVEAERRNGIEYLGTIKL